MKKGKGFCVVLCMLLVMAFSFSACGTASDNGTAPASPEKSASGADGAPAAAEKATLKIVVPQPASIIDFATNEFSKYMEEQTNVHVDWDQIPAEGSAEKVNIILASGDYPDAFMGVRLITPAQEAQYGMDEKVFIPLNDLIEKDGNYIKKAFEYLPDALGIITNPDGNIYSLPAISDCFHCQYQQKAWINTDWLKKLGLSTPVTTEDYYNVLKAFKERDPNGNGKSDEIPVMGGATWNGNPEAFLMNAFTYYDKNKPLVLTDGKIEPVANKPEFKEGLGYLNKLFKEGLLYEGSFTQTGDQMKQVIENPDAPIVGSFFGGASLFVATPGGDRYKTYDAMAPLKGPAGVQTAVYYPNEAVWTGMFSITKVCKNPDAAMKYADFMYSEDATMRLRQGIPGKQWDKAGADEKGINGQAAKWKRLTPWDTSVPQNDTIFDDGPFFETADMRLGQVFPSGVDMYAPEGTEKLLFETSKTYYEPYKPTKTFTIPPITFTKAENDEYMTSETEIKKYINESIIRFITGDMALDKDWDKYTKDLETMGYSKLVDIYQKAYERQYKK